MLRSLTIRVAVLAAGLSAGVSAHALEHVTLSNGFSYDCSRHESVDSGHVRLYLLTSDGKASDNFIDRPSQDIATIELLPDPPKTPEPTRATAQTPVLASTSVAAQSAPTDLRDLLAHAGTQHNIDVDLLASVVHAESGGQVKAVSRAGAQGLMQLMPSTAHDLGVTDTFQADQNINGGTAYLDMLLTRYDDPHNPKRGLDLALAAYNAGPAAVDRYHGIPPYPETRAYVSRVEREFIRRKAVLKSAANVASAH